MLLTTITAPCSSPCYDMACPVYLTAPRCTVIPNIADIAANALFGLLVVITVWKLAKMVSDLRHGNFGIDILAIIAIAACILTRTDEGVIAAYVICLMLCSGEALEELAARRAKKELSALIKRQPQIAHRLADDTIADIPLAKVKIGDVLLIKPGEVVPVDGQLISAAATLDESSLTGESLPVDKRLNDTIISGTLNQDDAFHIRVTTTADKSYYSQIIQLVKEAESQPAHFVNLANRYAVPFTLISLIIAGTAWALSDDFTRFAEVLVVASPCPLILAAPIAFVSGMSRASHRGIIVKGGDTLEQIAKADTFAFDKTGTLTTNQVTVDHVHTSQGYTKDMIVAMIAAVEMVSTHPLANSITSHAHQHNIELAPATGIREVPGGGIFASIDRRRLVVGSPAFLRSNKIVGIPDNIHNQTAILIAVNGQYVGAVYFTDTIRRGAKGLVKSLHQLGVDEVVMLTGDRTASAERIANELGLDKVYSELTPTDKVDVINQYRDQGHQVAMIGDGINDAPVLVTANVGIAMGTMGSTVAGESADAIITGSSIARVVELRQISTRTMTVAKQSVLTGIVICLILELIAVFGFIPAVIGALLQELVDISTMVNALRARK